MAQMKRKAGQTNDQAPPLKKKKDVESTAASSRPKRQITKTLSEDFETTVSHVKSNTSQVAAKRNAKNNQTDKSVATKAPKEYKASEKAQSTRKAKSTGEVKATSQEREQEKEEEEEEKGVDDEEKSYWLMKAEPESRMEKGVDVKFSIDDLAARKVPEPWDGVRNATARNNMRAMMKGDLAFFYHSNCKTPGIVGVMEIVQEHSVDESAFDEKHPYFDEKSTRDNPKWCVVHVEFRKKFNHIINLKELQEFSKQGGILGTMQVLRQSRLSVSKVSKEEWDFILGLAGVDPVTLEENETKE